MAGKTDTTLNKGSKTVPILGAVLAVLIAGMIISLCLPQKSGSVDFTPPPFDTNAVSGTPTVPEELGYASPYRDGMSYRFSICGNVTLKDGNAVVFFTNPAENNVWLKVRITDDGGSVLGESGIIEPGEFVETVSLSSDVAQGTNIKLKIMGYEPKTYRSAGSVTLNTSIGGKTK